MKEKSGPDSTFWQVKQARQLLDLGHHREALALALDALLQELHNLGASLVALKHLTQPQPEALRKELRPSPSCRLPGEKPRILH